MILASLILLPVSAAYAQNAAPRVTTAPTATVHIYRLRVFAGSKRRMTLSLDGERFAYLQNGRYWTVRLAPGDHVQKRLLGVCLTLPVLRLGRRG